MMVISVGGFEACLFRPDGPGMYPGKFWLPRSSRPPVLMEGYEFRFFLLPRCFRLGGEGMFDYNIKRSTALKWLKFGILWIFSWHWMIGLS